MSQPNTTPSIESLREEIEEFRVLRMRLEIAMRKHLPGSHQGRVIAEYLAAADDRFYDLREEIKRHPDYKLEGL